MTSPSEKAATEAMVGKTIAAMNRSNQEIGDVVMKALTEAFGENGYWGPVVDSLVKSSLFRTEGPTEDQLAAIVQMVREGEELRGRLNRLGYPSKKEYVKAMVGSKYGQPGTVGYQIFLWFKSLNATPSPLLLRCEAAKCLCKWACKIARDGYRLERMIGSRIRLLKYRNGGEARDGEEKVGEQMPSSENPRRLAKEQCRMGVKRGRNDDDVEPPRELPKQSRQNDDMDLDLSKLSL